MADDLMIEARGLEKAFGPTVALCGLDLEARAGSVLGVLGPNGAGKTTAVRILTTLSLPDAGSARVAGHDVVREAGAVQRKIGVTAQQATLDELLSGRQNLVMVGRLSGMRRAEARARAHRKTRSGSLSTVQSPASLSGVDRWAPWTFDRLLSVFNDEGIHFC